MNFYGPFHTHTLSTVYTRGEERENILLPVLASDIYPRSAVNFTPKKANWVREDILAPALGGVYIYFIYIFMALKMDSPSGRKLV